MTRQQRRDLRLVARYSACLERLAAVSAAARAGQDKLAASRAREALRAGAALAEIVTVLVESWRPPVRPRRRG